ncbi:MAG: amidohydrolase family protein [Bordetella sp.]|nr:amidohydrolase family protein [Bordetella sp.]
MALTPAQPRPLSIDTHAHVFVRGLPLVGARRYTPDYDATLADYLGLLDAHGMSHGVLVQPSFLGTDNSFMLAALAQARGRLRGVAVIDAAVTPAELADMNLAGVRGIRLNLMAKPTPPLTSAPWQTLLAAITALDWHVEVHMEAARLHEAVTPLLAMGCRVVVDHFGRPDPALGIADPGFGYLLDQGASGRVWVKLAAAYRNWRPADCAALGRQATHKLLTAFPADRLMWGSDWPHTENRDRADYRLACDWLRAWVDDDTMRHTLLAATPAALFGITGDHP